MSGGLAAGTALVVSAGGLGYRAYDEGVFQTGEGGAYDAWRDWNKQRGPMALVAAAILAANAHNTQAWLFHVSPQRIDVYADASRNIGAVDPFRREMYVSRHVTQGGVRQRLRARRVVIQGPGSAGARPPAPGPLQRANRHDEHAGRRTLARGRLGAPRQLIAHDGAQRRADLHRPEPV